MWAKGVRASVERQALDSHDVRIQPEAIRRQEIVQTVVFNWPRPPDMNDNNIYEMT